MAPSNDVSRSFKVVLPPELSQHYEDKNKVLGSGGFAKVILAEHIATGEKVAIKVMNKQYLEKKDDLHRAYNEIYALKHLSHRHVCQLFEVFECEEFIYLVIEYCPGGELFDYIVTKKRLNEKEARYLFGQIISAVAYFHENGYAHRDLKPENMLLDEDKNIKIIDFGLSAKPEHGLNSTLRTRAGSALYASPELISGEPYYGNTTDVWSLGVVLYALLCGFLPFDHESTLELYKKIKKGEFAKPPWLSQRSLKLLGAMLEVNPKKRITVDKIMSHEWMLAADYRQCVPVEPKKNRAALNYRAVQLIAAYFQWSLVDAENNILLFTYNQLTAFYYILCKVPEEKLMQMSKEWLHRDNFIGEANSSQVIDTNALDAFYKFSVCSDYISALIVPTINAPPEPYSTHNTNTNTKSNNKTQNHNNNNGINTLQNTTQKKRPTSLHANPHRLKLPERNDSQAQQVNMNDSKLRSKSLDSRLSSKVDSSSTKPQTKQTSGKSERRFKELCTTTFDRIWRHRSSTIDSSLASNDKTVQLKNVHRSKENLHSIAETKVNGSVRKTSRTNDPTNLYNTRRLATSCMDNLDSMKIHRDQKIKENSLERNDGLNKDFDKRTRTRSMMQLTQRLSGFFKHEIKPRKAKAVYHVENTSYRPPHELKNELARVLGNLVKSEHITSFSNPDDSYLFKCKLVEEQNTTIFELEICIVPKMENVAGIRRKRIKGDSWRYKELVELILGQTSL